MDADVTMRAIGCGFLRVQATANTTWEVPVLILSARRGIAGSIYLVQPEGGLAIRGQPTWTRADRVRVTSALDKLREEDARAALDPKVLREAARRSDALVREVLRPGESPQVLSD